MVHNCFPFTPNIMNLYTKTPHKKRMCQMDFRVKRLKVKSQYIDDRKWFISHNCFPFTSIITKIHTKTPDEMRICPIDLGIKKSNVKVTMH